MKVLKLIFLVSLSRSAFCILSQNETTQTPSANQLSSAPLLQEHMAGTVQTDMGINPTTNAESADKPVFKRYAALEVPQQVKSSETSNLSVKRKLGSPEEQSINAALSSVDPKKPVIIITNVQPQPPNSSMIMIDKSQQNPFEHPYHVVSADQYQSDTVVNTSQSTVSSSSTTPSTPKVIDQWGSLVYTPGMTLPPGVNIVNYDQQSQQFVTSNAQASGESPYSAKIVVAPVTFADIDTLITVANSIFGIYNQYFDLIPDATQPADKTWTDKTVAAILLYAKVRNLVITFATKRQKLITEITYLNGKVSGLQSSEEDMVKFYSLENQYFRTKLNTMLFAPTNIKIKGSWDEMESTRAEFEIDLRRVIQATSAVVSFAIMFEDNIHEIGRLDYDSTVLNILDKIDDVMMMLVKLVEMKQNIQQCITDLKTGLINIKIHRLKIIELLTSLNQAADIERAADLLYSDVKKDSTFFGSTAMSAGLVLLAIASMA